jgi:hypothetical protein
VVALVSAVPVVLELIILQPTVSWTQLHPASLLLIPGAETKLEGAGFKEVLHPPCADPGWLIPIQGDHQIPQKQLFWILDWLHQFFLFLQVILLLQEKPEIVWGGYLPHQLVLPHPGQLPRLQQLPYLLVLPALFWSQIRVTLWKRLPEPRSRLNLVSVLILLTSSVTKLVR